MVEKMSRVVNFIRVLLPSLGFLAVCRAQSQFGQHQMPETHIPIGSFTV
ncbi:MAG: hypothetical protein KJ624_06445 [Chloroflexi bacterium]|nr:hypothetical protein [Chloroflexota bacterium]